MDSYGNHNKSSGTKFTKIQKNFYTYHEDTKNRPQSIIDQYMRESELECVGADIPRPVFTFRESNLPKYLVDQLESCYQKPSVIQS